MAVPAGVHEVYGEHIRLDSGLTPAEAQFVGGSRLTDDFQENLWGHRSGIGATGVGGNGVQNVATAMNNATMTNPPKNYIGSWHEQWKYRWNVDNY